MSLSRAALNARAQESQLLELKNKITCKVCKKFYNNAKTLSCLHSFCVSCLRTLRTEDNEESLSCSECAKVTPIPLGDVNNFPDAFALNRKLEEYRFLQKVLGRTEAKCEKCSGKSVKATMFCEGCSKFVCDLCVTIHKSWSEFTSHKLMKLSDLKDAYQSYIPDHSTTPKCKDHGKECTIFCETCKKEICHECIIKSHRDHRYNLVADSAKQHRADMEKKLYDIDGIPEQMNKAINKLDSLTNGLSARGKVVNKEVVDTFTKLESVVVQRKSTLLDQATSMVDTKVKLLQDQKKVLVEVKAKVMSCQEFVKQTIENGRNPEFFLLEKQMMDRISEVGKEFTCTELTPVEEPQVQFTVDTDLASSLDTLGHISDGSILHVGPKAADLSPSQGNFIVKEIVTFYIALSSAYYKMTNNPSEELLAEFESVRDGSVCPATVAISNSGFAKIQCAFADRGRYLLKVLVGEQHITGSPHSFIVKPAADQFNHPIRSITKLTSPRGVAINKKHHIIATQETAHTVTVYGRKCKKLLSFGSFGTQESQFNHPTGVAVDDDGNIYVADSKNNRIQKFDAQGSFLAAFGGDANSESGLLSAPTGIKINCEGEIFVVDRGNGRVVVLTQELKFKCAFGSPGQGLSQFQDPWDIAFDSRGFCYVTDIKQHCIFIFTCAGDFRGRIGAMGSQKSRLNRPTGIAINRFGQIFVCEMGNHRVSIFHISSEFIECFSGGLSMVNPCGVVTDEDGFVYLSTAEAVHVF